MIIKLISDLHLELSDFSISHSNEDILILAGDISSNSKDTLDLISYYLLSNTSSQIIYILGNHDYYNKSIDETITFWKNIQIDRFHFLHDSSTVINKFRFYGTTLWTDLNNLNFNTMYNCNKYINDYRYIKGNFTSDRFTPEESYMLHMNSKTLLAQTLNNITEPVIVISHHLPSHKSIAPKHKNSILNGAFYSNLDNLVQKAHTWFHGHTHSSVDYTINNTRVICNPRGYIINGIPENTNFNPNFTIKIE